MPGQMLDHTDRRLIELLQHDGRASYAALAKAVDKSEAAVRQRVQRMRDAGVMQIVAVTDPLRLGFGRQSLIGIKVDGDLRVVTDALSAMPETTYVVICAGGYDVLVELLCADDDELLAVLGSKIRGVPGVVAAETFVYLKLAKQTYAWGTP
jgi:Lrp/AsnC family transcriptional regulator for asnA, asnC and gidA